jgi:hypothetical protein
MKEFILNKNRIVKLYLSIIKIKVKMIQMKNKHILKLIVVLMAATVWFMFYYSNEIEKIYDEREQHMNTFLQLTNHYFNKTSHTLFGVDKYAINHCVIAEIDDRDQKCFMKGGEKNIQDDEKIKKEYAVNLLRKMKSDSDLSYKEVGYQWRKLSDNEPEFVVVVKMKLITEGKITGRYIDYATAILSSNVCKSECCMKEYREQQEFYCTANIKLLNDTVLLIE